MKPINVCILDDHQVVIDGLVSVLSEEVDIQVVNTALTGEVFLGQLRRFQPEVVILDYSLSNTSQPNTLNGFDTAKEIMNKYPSVRVLMLTMHSNKEVIIPCIESGVHGYMLKSERNFDVAYAIREVYSRGRYFSPEIASSLALNIREYRLNVVTLTSREKEVLEAIFQGNTTSEMADALCISTNTVETHRRHLLEKFEAKNSLHLVYKALQGGYLKLESKRG